MTMPSSSPDVFGAILSSSGSKVRRVEVPNAVPRENLGAERTPADAEAARRRSPRYQLRVDFSEQKSALLDLARASGEFDVQMARLRAGDYRIDERVLVERKTYSDFATSLADGRLFPQAAVLAQSPHRSVILLEGPRPLKMPDVHPHAIKGALVSLAVMWRLPVLHARDPEDSLRILRLLAHQVRNSDPGVLRRYGQKPKRLASRRLHMLQGLPGIGPALADRLLAAFGSVERVVAADETMLAHVRGVGPTKARRIRELVGC
jgi:ERCC4-type nuclease